MGMRVREIGFAPGSFVREGIRRGASFPTEPPVARHDDYPTMYLEAIGTYGFSFEEGWLRERMNWRPTGPPVGRNSCPNQSSLFLYQIGNEGICDIGPLLLPSPTPTLDLLKIANTSAPMQIRFKFSCI